MHAAALIDNSKREAMAVHSPANDRIGVGDVIGVPAFSRGRVVRSNEVPVMARAFGSRGTTPCRDVYGPSLVGIFLICSDECGCFQMLPEVPLQTGDGNSVDCSLVIRYFLFPSREAAHPLCRGCECLLPPSVEAKVWVRIVCFESTGGGRRVYHHLRQRIQSVSFDRTRARGLHGIGKESW
jgi:hypothetical protein